MLQVLSDFWRTASVSWLVAGPPVSSRWPFAGFARTIMLPRFVCLVVGFLLPAAGIAAARLDTKEDLLKQARIAWENRQPDKAVELAGKAIALDPKDARLYLFRGSLREALGRHDDAIADFDKCLEIDPKNPEAYNHRGSEQFRRGKIAEALADFDRFLELRPAEFPGHWKRGIALYYLGRYADGRKQFAGYEKVDTNDVENAVWHFLCAAREVGVDKARAGMLKIGKDRRVPMMRVYALFKGEAKPEDVLEEARAGKPDPRELEQRLFYAYLYLGLYYEALGDKKNALENLTMAVDKHPNSQYMGDVARVHRDLLRKEATPK
jgi:lipoprotein NlpI